jgi:senataxin
LGPQSWSKKINTEKPSSDGYQQSAQRQASLKQSADSKQLKGRPLSSQRAPVSGQVIADQKPSHKRSIISKKQASVNNTQYQDSSVERLIREVTSDKFWHNPGNFLHYHVSFRYILFQ